MIYDKYFLYGDDIQIPNPFYYFSLNAGILLLTILIKHFRLLSMGLFKKVVKSRDIIKEIQDDRALQRVLYSN